MDVTAVVRRGAALGIGAALVVALADCGRDRAPAADSGVATGAARDGKEIPKGGKPACAATGHWAHCSVLKRLEAAGVAPQPATALPDLPSLGPSPALYTVGHSGLAVYLYPDSAARSRAAKSLDTARYVSPATTLTMRGETTAIQNDNLLALLFSRNEQQRERVSDALTAGPPQLEKP